MVLIEEKIKRIMLQLRLQYPELVKYGGLGYCGYGSALLQNALLAENIDSQLITGKHFTNSPNAQHAILATKRIILGIDDAIEDDPLFLSVKKNYIRRGCSLPKKSGHAAILFNNKIFDITSEQFDFQHVYSYEFFETVWERIAIANVTIDESVDFKISDVDFIEVLKPKITEKNKSILKNW